jgi:ABC-type multidrug transport system ATPase subunit
MIVAVNLHKNYGRKPVLRGMSLRVEPGELTLLVGSNGAGKSTTMRILAGLSGANAGTAWINGHDIIRARKMAQRFLSYLPQNPQFHPRLRCIEVLKFYARLRGIDVGRCAFVLEQIGLTEAAQERTGALSGGMRQRLGLALLLLAQSPVLLLDEPGISLDPGWRTRLQEILRAEADGGRAVLVTTHLIAEWNGVADRCLLCRDGTIERDIDPNDLPQNFDEAVEQQPGSVAAVYGGRSRDLQGTHSAVIDRRYSNCA